MPAVTVKGPGREQSGLIRRRAAIDREIAWRLGRPVERAGRTVAEQVERLAEPVVVGVVILATAGDAACRTIGKRTTRAKIVVIIDAADEPECMAELVNGDGEKVRRAGGDAVARVEVELEVRTEADRRVDLTGVCRRIELRAGVAERLGVRRRQANDAVVVTAVGVVDLRRVVDPGPRCVVGVAWCVDTDRTVRIARRGASTQRRQDLAGIERAEATAIEPSNDSPAVLAVNVLRVEPRTFGGRWPKLTLKLTVTGVAPVVVRTLDQ